MGRYSVPLAPRFAEFAGVRTEGCVLDVGCGPGALTGELVRRLGPPAVWAVDPSESFVEAVRSRHGGVRVRRTAAEQLPFEDRLFDVALAQLVVHFMADPVAGLREMGRVTREGGVVAACVWDHAGGQGPLSVFWDTAREVDSDLEDDWWEPFTLGVGPAGRFVTQLDHGPQIRLRELCRKRLPPAPFRVSATAWVARGRV